MLLDTFASLLFIGLILITIGVVGRDAPMLRLTRSYVFDHYFYVACTGVGAMINIGVLLYVFTSHFAV